jgi:hypothetical protein
MSQKDIVRYVMDGDNKFYYYLRYPNAIGSFQWKYEKRINEGIIYPLDDFDKRYYAHIKLKENEHLFRYRTDRMMAGYRYLIKMNLENAMIYFMEEYEDDKNPKFFTRGIKADYILIEYKSLAHGGSVGLEDNVYIKGTQHKLNR